MYKIGIITASDKGSKGERIDESGKLIQKIMEAADYQVADYQIVPDEQKALKNAMLDMADRQGVDLILTTGGTGFSPRDVTPEATMEIATRNAPGIAEAIRSYSLTITGRAMLSRGASVLRNSTLIVNLPGSPKAVQEALTYILPQLDHGLGILQQTQGECAR